MIILGGLVLYLNSMQTLERYGTKGNLKRLQPVMYSRRGEELEVEKVADFSIGAVTMFLEFSTASNYQSQTTAAPFEVRKATQASKKISRKAIAVETTRITPPASTRSWPTKKFYDPYYEERLKAYNKSGGKEKSGCHRPLLNPWDKQSQKAMVRRLTQLAKEGPYKCEEKPLLLQLSKDKTMILLDEEKFMKYENRSQLKNCKMASMTVDSYPDSLRTIPDLRAEEKFQIKIPEESDVVFVGCVGLEDDSSLMSLDIKKKEKWIYYQMFLRLTPAGKDLSVKLQNQKSRNKRRLSVLMFYNDGISHLMSRRVMNKTHYYLINEQKGVALNGYNSVGQNTFPNMSPLLTGYHVEELPAFKGKYFDKIAWPLVWYNFSKSDYVTGYAEDSGYPTFDYVKKGFYDKPVDYYFKTYLRYIEKLGKCDANEKYVHQTMLNLLDQFLTLHADGDYFFLWFLNSLSHYGAGPLFKADDEFHAFLKKHFEKGTFKNTLFVFGSDHGPNHGSIIDESGGQIERRLPLQVLVFPEWFRKEYPEKYQTLLDNQNALTTPFDVHETLLDIVENESEVDKGKRRGINLLKEKVPHTRSCSEAGIPAQYCECRKLSDIPTSNTSVISAVKATVEHINKLLEPYNELCEVVVLQNIIHGKIKTGQARIKDDAVDFADYIVVFETMPYHARFEAMVRHYNESSEYKVVGQPFRASLYGDTAYCMKDAVLRSYCYCKVQRKSAST